MFGVSPANSLLEREIKDLGDGRKPDSWSWEIGEGLWRKQLGLDKEIWASNPSPAAVCGAVLQSLPAPV